MFFFIFLSPLSPIPFLFLVLHFQKDAMEDSVEIVIEKLLHVTKDIDPKVILFLLKYISYYSLLAFLSMSYSI